MPIPLSLQELLTAQGFDVAKLDLSGFDYSSLNKIAGSLTQVSQLTAPQLQLQPSNFLYSIVAGGLPIFAGKISKSQTNCKRQGFLMRCH